jgi:GDP-4-dehydro-6-deoxy-D-mannose reductase
MRSVWITGAAGFVGRHLSRRLRAEEDTEIVGLDLLPRDPHASSDRWLHVDLADPAALEPAIAEHPPDRLFHLAGLGAGPSQDVYRANLLATVQLLESFARLSPATRILIVGSSAEYGRVAPEDMPVTEDHACRPFGAYGISKHAAVLAGLALAHERGLKLTVARPFNVLGPGIGRGLVVGAILGRAKEALASADAVPRVRIGNLDAERDFVAVDDLVDGFVRQMAAERWGEVFNYCSGTARSIRRVIEELLGHASRPLTLEVDPALARGSEVPCLTGSWRRAHEAFGFRPKTDLSAVLEATFREAIGDGRR